MGRAASAGWSIESAKRRHALYKPIGCAKVPEIDRSSIIVKPFSGSWNAWGRASVDAVGHRVVHGGERFTKAVCIDATVMAEIEQLSELAPLHNPACLAGINAARAALGHDMPMVAVFDTAFHRTMPERAATYAIPQNLAEKYGITRYGFHGIAHASLVHGLYGADGTTCLREDRHRPAGGHRSRHHAASRERVLRRGDPGRQLRGYLHGVHPVGRLGDGHPLRRPRFR